MVSAERIFPASRICFSINLSRHSRESGGSYRNPRSLPLQRSNESGQALHEDTEMDDFNKKIATDKTNERNAGMDFNPDWLAKVQINRSAIERRAGSLSDRRSIKKHWQVAWLLQAISCIDLTTLAGDDTPGRVRRLCNKAMNPVRREILSSLDLEDLELSTGAVCVYHGMLETANQILASSRGRNARPVGLAAVSAGFPAGLNALPLRIAEIDASVAAGATEIDIVISRRHALSGNWRALYDEVRSFREASGEAHLKAGQVGPDLGYRAGASLHGGCRSPFVHQHDEIGPMEGTGALTERPPREKAPMDPLARGYQDDIQVPSEPTVLEAVVENEDVG